MKIICYKCETIIDRDKYIDGQLVEEYKNIYGTVCPNCGFLIKPFIKSSLKDENQLKMEILKNEMKEKLRKKYKEKKCL